MGNFGHLFGGGLSGMLAGLVSQDSSGRYAQYQQMQLQGYLSGSSHGLGAVPYQSITTISTSREYRTGQLVAWEDEWGTQHMTSVSPRRPASYDFKTGRSACGCAEGEVHKSLGQCWLVNRVAEMRAIGRAALA